ncbi:hypothetical protein AXG93_4322s1010 [Marchantia polymorpha subsp. ruderalis]|uniref:Calmodulin binding protein-like N-terminal domain-containing protein n=1 Tax=Marchantia polymorpha subsp. ruderalis TaxID=1480154 RepID=A0A176VQP4_MARPO|nr:hypothetical protein AXG93_4322s1010 [Marchantia polymorpha subsp. ruderalis]
MGILEVVKQGSRFFTEDDKKVARMRIDKKDVEEEEVQAKVEERKDGAKKERVLKEEEKHEEESEEEEGRRTGRQRVHHKANCPFGSNASHSCVVPLVSSPKRIQGSDSRSLRLQFRNKLALPLFTGSKVEGEQGSAIHVVLQDASTGQVVAVGAESSAKLEVVVLEGDFSADDEEDWPQEDFQNPMLPAIC